MDWICQSCKAKTLLSTEPFEVKAEMLEVGVSENASTDGEKEIIEWFP